MQNRIKKILAGVAAVLVVLYIADGLWLRVKIQKNNNPFGTVQVLTYSMVPEKNNREEFFYGDPETDQCVHSLFPHLGNAPCWYTGKTREKRTDL